MKIIYSIFLYSSLILFAKKGIEYAILGSFIPLILSIVFIAIVCLMKKSRKKTNMVLKLWAILLLVWSFSRIIIGLADTFLKELTENQIQQNMGIFGYIISILFIYIGTFLLNKNNRNNWLQRRV